MVQETKSSNAKATFLFLLLGLPVLAVVVGAPFYASFIQTPQRKTEVAIEIDIDTIDRAVFNVDAQLAALRDSGGDEKPEISEEVSNKKDPYDKGTLASLQQTAASLRAAVDADQKRQIKSKAAAQITPGPASISSVYGDFKKVITAQEKALKEGDSAMRRLPSASHLWSNRAKAIYLGAQAQLQRCRGDFEAWQARLFRDNARASAGPLAEMRRTSAAIDAQKPTVALAALAKSIEEQTAAQAAAQEAVKKLSDDVNARESKAKALESSATEKRTRMSELMTSGLGGASGREYLQLSNEARKEEAEATAIRYGTLSNAKAADQAFDSAMPKYEGGTPSPGTRDSRLEDRQQEAALIDAHKAELSRQQQALTEASSQLDAQKAEVTKSIDALAESLSQLIAEADKHADAARKAYDEATKTLANASRSAKAAVGDAKKWRTSDTKAGGQDERLKRIADDGDLEGSMHCLAAELAFQTALIDAARISLAEGDAEAKAAVSGEKAAASEEDIEKLRTDAANQLAEATKSYEQAANLISRTSAKFADGTSISGKNYVWQVQMGQVAVQLLKSALADKPEDRIAAQEAAYRLLADPSTGIIKGREQSPLIAPALETLAYLQQTAR